MPDAPLFKICVSAFLVRDNTILLLKRADDDSFLPGAWEVPGGGIDPHETIEEGLKRETLEEAGLDIEIGALFGYFEYTDGKGRKAVNLNFLCRMGDSAQAANVSSGEMQEARWVRLEDLETIPFTSSVMADACGKALSLSA